MNTVHSVNQSAPGTVSDRDANATHPNMVTGLFPDRSSAERAYSSITSRGYEKGDINLVMSDQTRKAHFADTDNVDTDLGTKAAEGAAKPISDKRGTKEFRIDVAGVLARRAAKIAYDRAKGLTR